MTDLEKLTEMVGRSHRIVAFTGAGVSTESNIPDFRSSKGVYETIRRVYGRPPEVLLSHSFFEAHPDIFYDYLRKYLVYEKAEPNDAHKALQKLEEMGRLQAVVTQNIDGLHTRAGSENVLELHGSLARNRCVRCGRTYDLAYVLAVPEGGVPRCEACGGLVRPDIVLYEEPLDGKVLERAVGAIRTADLLLVMGTSLVVYPAAGLIRYFTGDDLVLINRSETPYDGDAALVLHEAAGATMKRVMQALGAD